jgi:predicted transcriptional regulator
LNISKTQQHRFLNQLLSLEYVKQVGGQGNSRHRYQVVYWDDNEKLRKAIQQQLNEQLSLL